MSSAVVTFSSMMEKEPRPASTRDLRVSVPVAVAFTRHTDEDSSAAWPWSPHNLASRGRRLAPGS